MFTFRRRSIRCDDTSGPAEPTLRLVRLDAPFTDQKPGTSGLRKSSQQFEQANYLESFVEAVFRLPGVQGGTLVLGGDGRYGNRRAIDVILRMGMTHGLSKLINAYDDIRLHPGGLENLIRRVQAIGGIILSAEATTLAAPMEDFGVKVNGANGGPTPASFTDAVFSAETEQYAIVDAAIAIDTHNGHSIGAMQVEVIDGVDDFVALMQQLFDFDPDQELIRAELPAGV